MAGGSLVWSSLRAEDVSNIESQALWEEWPKSHVQQGSALILVTCSTCLAVSFRIESIVVFFRWFGLLRHTLKRKKADGGTAAPSTAFPLCSRSWFCMVLWCFVFISHEEPDSSASSASICRLWMRCLSRRYLGWKAFLWLSQVRLQYVSKVPGSEKSIKALCSPHGWKPSDRIEVPQKSSCCNGGGGRRGRGKMGNVTPLLPWVT